MNGFTVIGLTEGDIQHWGGPVHRLRDCLVEQLGKIQHDLFTADTAIIYAISVNGDRSAAFERLCSLLPSCRGFSQILFLNSTASQACDKFGIPIVALGTVSQDDIPPERNVALERPYFHGL